MRITYNFFDCGVQPNEILGHSNLLTEYNSCKTIRSVQLVFGSGKSFIHSSDAHGRARHLSSGGLHGGGCAKSTNSTARAF